MNKPKTMLTCQCCGAPCPDAMPCCTACHTTPPPGWTDCPAAHTYSNGRINPCVLCKGTRLVQTIEPPETPTNTLSLATLDATLRAFENGGHDMRKPFDAGELVTTGAAECTWCGVAGCTCTEDFRAALGSDVVDAKNYGIGFDLVAKDDMFGIFDMMRESLTELARAAQLTCYWCARAIPLGNQYCDCKPRCQEWTEGETSVIRHANPCTCHDGCGEYNDY